MGAYKAYKKTKKSKEHRLVFQSLNRIDDKVKEGENNDFCVFENDNALELIGKAVIVWDDEWNALEGEDCDG